MLSQQKTLIRGINYHCIIQNSFFFQIIKQTAHLFIYRTDSPTILFYIPLIFPPKQILSNRRIFQEFFIFLVINSFPCGTLFAIHLSHCHQPTVSNILQCRFVLQFSHLKIERISHVPINCQLLSFHLRTTCRIVIK